MTIILIVAIAFILYRLADGRPLANIIAAASVVMAFTLLDPTLQGLPLQAYMLAGLVMWLGLQVALPIVEGRQVVKLEFGRVPALRVGRLAVAVLPVGV